jgi:cysteinyl-tRNA synthetase
MFQFYNTLTRHKEEFKPANPPAVSFYQCGPTVYWTQHIGNMRAMVLADFLVRSLRYSGFKVKFARNYTDVGHLTSDEDSGEDKMEKAAKREGKSPLEIAEHYIEVFENDVAALNCLEPDVKPRATEYVKQMQEMVQALIDKGFCYATDLAVYFDISKAKDYTRLSGQDLEKNISEAGKGDASDPGKRNSADFSVWFFKAGAHKNALQTWSHKFIFSDGKIIEGEGFPGWHLECSAMNYAIFGPTIDIHMGGVEHIPVHHTNEIAQIEAFSGEKFVHLWLHNEHLMVDGGKMSKSLGNVYSVDSLKEQGFEPLVYRYFLLGAHYRSKQNFTLEALQGAKSAFDKLRETVRDWEVSGEKISEEYKKRFFSAIEDDLNTPQALAVMWEMIGDATCPSSEKAATLLEFDKVLGLKLDEFIGKKTEVPDEVMILVKAREAARVNKNWSESDRLRDEIAKLGFIVEDTPQGQKIKNVLV